MPSNPRICAGCFAEMRTLSFESRVISEAKGAAVTCGNRTGETCNAHPKPELCCIQVLGTGKPADSETWFFIPHRSYEEHSGGARLRDPSVHNVVRR